LQIQAIGSGVVDEEKSGRGRRAVLQISFTQPASIRHEKRVFDPQAYLSPAMSFQPYELHRAVSPQIHYFREERHIVFTEIRFFQKNGSFLKVGREQFREVTFGQSPPSAEQTEMLITFAGADKFCLGKIPKPGYMVGMKMGNDDILYFRSSYIFFPEPGKSGFGLIQKNRRNAGVETERKNRRFLKKPRSVAGVEKDNAVPGMVDEGKQGRQDYVFSRPAPDDDIFRMRAIACLKKRKRQM
jgi:hypothetical protein